MLNSCVESIKISQESHKLSDQNTGFIDIFVIQIDFWVTQGFLLFSSTLLKLLNNS